MSATLLRAPAAPFQSPSGEALSLADLLEEAGGKPLLLAFFKTSCPTCKLTWPYLEALNRAYGGRGIHVVGVSQNDANASEAFYAQHGNVSFGLVLDPEPGFAASNAWGVEAVPHLALVAPDGTILRTFEGWQRKEIEALAADAARGAGIPYVPVIDPGDPVPALKAG